MASEAPEMRCQGCIRVYELGTTEDSLQKLNLRRQTVYEHDKIPCVWEKKTSAHILQFWTIVQIIHKVMIGTTGKCCWELSFTSSFILEGAFIVDSYV